MVSNNNGNMVKGELYIMQAISTNKTKEYNTIFQQIVYTVFNLWKSSIQCIIEMVNNVPCLCLAPFNLKPSKRIGTSVIVFKIPLSERIFLFGPNDCAQWFLQHVANKSNLVSNSNLYLIQFKISLRINPLVLNL
eukprot:47158_1